MFLNLRQSLAVWLIKKVQKYGPHKICVDGRSYLISENVFNPKYYYTSKFMAKHISVKPDDIVLDMGTGSGIQAITVGLKASKVIAIDINPEAVQYAKDNVKANGLDKVVSVLEGDLFSPLKGTQRFDVILFTPPYMVGKPKTYFDHALFDSDKELVSRFFRETGDYLTPDGYVQMLYSSIANPEKVLELSRLSGWNSNLVAREQTYMESFLIYRFTLQSSEIAKGDIS